MKRVMGGGKLVSLCSIVLCSTAVVRAEALEVSPMSWDYGDVVVGSSETANFDMKSMGPTAVWIYIILLNETADDDPPYVCPDDPVDPLWSLGPFSFNSSTWIHQPFEFPSGDHFMLDVTFSPTSPGHYSSYLGFISNDADGQDMMFLPLEGTGVPAAIPATWTLITSSSDGGDVVVPGEGSYQYEKGSIRDLVAVADHRGYRFVSWTGTAVNANKVADPCSANTTVTIDADYTVIANFAVNPWTLTVSSSAGGSVISPGEGTFQYNHGDQVMLQAKADPMFTFVGWRGGVFANQNPYSLTMNADYEVKAHFESALDVLYVDDNAYGDPGPGDPNVSDPRENGMPKHPFDMVQEAIDVAKKGAKVIVRAGTYLETIDLLGKSIEVNGLNSDDPNIVALPIIDGQGKDTVVRCTQREDPNCILAGFVITGGQGRLAGGILCVGSSPSIVNCLIVGNRATALDGGAGGVYSQDSNALFANCTVSGNYGGTNGAGMWFKDSKAVVTNSIAWGNTPTEILAQGSIQPVIGYTDVAGSWLGVGNLDANPLFALPGYWANPKDLTKTMAPSDPTAVWVHGDYPLRSQAGRWDPVAEKWVMDAITSPCIDAGDPLSLVGAEPKPNGSGINMGAYGGTSQASKSNK